MVTEQDILHKALCYTDDMPDTEEGIYSDTDVADGYIAGYNQALADLKDTPVSQIRNPNDTLIEMSEEISAMWERDDTYWNAEEEIVQEDKRTPEATC